MAEYVTKINKEKTDAVEELKGLFKQSTDYIFADYRGLSVSQITELRDKLREQHTAFRVVKNRFAKIALKDMGKPEVEELFIGPTAVAMPAEEAGPATKILVDYGKDHPIEIKGGIIDGRVFDMKQMEAFSKLPTRLELIAQLMGTMNAPLQNFVYTLNAVPQKLVRVLQAVADKKESE
jgi:large subunit ribosomal protein L10